MNKLIFSPANIMLPKYKPTDGRWTKWGIIACDQFTSEPEYWSEAEKTAGDESALSLILPEAYLGTEKQAKHEAKIKAMMKSLPSTLDEKTDVMIYLERTLPDGRIRHGIIGKIDLEEYDYKAGSTSAVRATEATVLERIPPREAVRAEAEIELPHVMLLIEDKEGLFALLDAKKTDMPKLYGFDLMLGGGHAVGYLIDGKVKDEVTAIIARHESENGKLAYAIGDGNHSLAAAKSHYEHIKAKVGDSHPARYALAEVVAIGDGALEFEPIYRVVTPDDKASFLAELEAITEAGIGDETITVIADGGKTVRHFAKPTHALTVGSLQIFIDGYMKSHPGTSCDYIHDEASLTALANKQGNVGFLFDGMKKDELFSYVEAHGTLPRKTFSMGEARSKRYYIEARRITE